MFKMFKPLNSRVLIKPDSPKREKKTHYGIILSSDDEKSLTGIVVVGNKEVQKNERIAFSKFGYDEIIIKNERYYLVSSNSLLGVFT